MKKIETEDDWLACTDPTLMLEFLRGKASDRKLRLLACACCRHVWDLLLDEQSRQAVNAAEQYADGLISHDARILIHDAARAARKAIKKEAPQKGYSPCFNAARAAECVVEGSLESLTAAIGWVSTAVGNQAVPVPADGDFDDAYEAVWHFQMFYLCPVIRCIFGNPFRPVSPEASRLTSNVVNLAHEIYDDRAFDRLPILADALERAGCTDNDIIGHCRQPGEHVRGCWVVDMLLGQE
jgi:hypothetical protein